MKKKAPPKNLSRLVLYFVLAPLATFVGSIAGLLLGMTVGGNFPPVFEYGGLPGYEGAGLLGSALGASAVLLVLIVLRLSRSIQRDALLLWLGASCLVLVGEHLIALQNHLGSFPFLFLVPLAQGLLFLSHKPEEF